MNQKMNPVVHFEMPAEDKNRMRKFYETTFGWQTNQLGPEMGNYITVTTTETAENRMVKKPGTINGGFFQKTNDPISQYPSIVIQVENLEDSIKKVEAGGGKISGNIDTIPSVGKVVSIIDTEGNRISLIEPVNN